MDEKKVWDPKINCCLYLLTADDVVSLLVEFIRKKQKLDTDYCRQGEGIVVWVIRVT